MPPALGTNYSEYAAKTGTKSYALFFMNSALGCLHIRVNAASEKLQIHWFEWNSDMKEQ